MDIIKPKEDVMCQGFMVYAYTNKIGKRINVVCKCSGVYHIKPRLGTMTNDSSIKMYASEEDAFKAGWKYSKKEKSWECPECIKRAK